MNIMMLMTVITTALLHACALDLAKMATILVHVLTLSMSSCHSRELLCCLEVSWFPCSKWQNAGTGQEKKEVDLLEDFRPLNLQF